MDQAMNRAYYAESIAAFLESEPNKVLGALAKNSEFAVQQAQSDAWLEEISALHSALRAHQGSVYFEYSIPRMGRRIDVVLLIGPAVFVLEFKVGDRDFASHALDQVVDYALDLKNFHEPSHKCLIVPVLIATNAMYCEPDFDAIPLKEGILPPIKTNGQLLGTAIDAVLRSVKGATIDPGRWESGRYCPTPTIIEAALALYSGHSVAEISRSDASAINLTVTSESIFSIIETSKASSIKSICFVTGVPGAGKTLVGLNMATTHIDKTSDLYSVFLSGNGPLVAVLREALARDKIRRTHEQGSKLKKGAAMSEVKAFVQNIHHFRDESLRDSSRPPIEHVAIFDEAQRAWNLQQTSSFMLRKKRVANFNRSEPEFLISYMDRHRDWAVIVCLVGGGQEINTGEAGITEWIESLLRSSPHWRVYISAHLTDSEYAAGEALAKIQRCKNVSYNDDLHLGVSMRSFRAENVSLLVKQILDLELEQAQKTLDTVRENYPIVLTRDLARAKQWLRERARGTERYGIVASSQAERLKPDAINVRAPLDPIHWFLDGKEDVRSSYYLEDAATEFHVQGLELDWTCVNWDADFRCSRSGWEHWSFCGDRWRHIK
jgi:Schlafen group 3, DNA/RNA helicase domain